MRDIVKFAGAAPQDARGFVTIDYTDPVTGKVKERVRGENHVFKDCLFGGAAISAASQTFSVLAVLESLPLGITESRTPIDPDFPYVLGLGTGYGIPLNSGNGLYVGAWNASLGFNKAVCTANGYRVKYVYDYLPTQALGTVGTIGLSLQWGARTGNARALIPGRPFSPSFTASESNIGQSGVSVGGRYTYDMGYDSGTYYIDKYDQWNATKTSIPASDAIPEGHWPRSIGYEPSTGAFYIYTYYSGTPAVTTKLHKFADDTFSSIVESYAGSTMYNFNFYVCNGKAYGINTEPFAKVDFANGTAKETISISHGVLSGGAEGTAGARGAFLYGTTRMVLLGGYDSVYGRINNAGFIFDLSTEETLGYCSPPWTVTNRSGYSETAAILHPSTTNKVFGMGSQYYNGVSCSMGEFSHCSAIAAYRVPDDAPVRPEGYGMQVSYELEVLY